MLHLRIYGPSDAIAEVGERLEDRGLARYVALAPGVHTGRSLLTAEIRPESADEVIDFLASRGVAHEDIALARLDEIGPIVPGRGAVTSSGPTCWGRREGTPGPWGATSP